MEREQIIKALECCSKTTCEDCPYTKNGKVDIFDITCSVNMAKDALALINELIEKNEGLEDNLIKQSAENIMLLIEQQEIKANTVRRMQSDIQEACLKGGIWPAFVARVVERVGDKILEENNVQVAD
jgi:hypothetical protein